MSGNYSTRRHKKRTQYGIGFIVCAAVLGFLIIGFIISFSIRACARHYVSDINLTQHDTPDNIYVGNEPVETQNHNYQYIMPDSIIRICMPKPLVGNSEKILLRTSYIVSYNQETKLPNWVSWNLTAEHTDGPYQRLNNFHEDEEVSLPRATLEDYIGSGWSRGHMCPAGDNKWDFKAMFDTFSLSNVCPQNAKLNSGLWNSIEIDCRRWARRFGDIYIVCGPLFFSGEHETIGYNHIIVPDAFFKVVLCLRGVPKGIGFIVRNNEGTKKNDLYYNSIDQVERLTGIDFFPALPDDLENEVEAAANLNDWR